MFVFPIALPNTAVSEIQKALLQIEGVLLGFSAVTYAYLISGVESRIAVYIQMQSKERELKNARTLSVRLTKGALAVFVSLTLSFVYSVGVLTTSLVNTTSSTLWANVTFFPLFLIVLGLVVILANMMGLIEEHGKT